MAADPYRYFRVEARDLVDQMGQAVLDLEKGAAPERLARILRLAHTLKGAARVVRQRGIADQAHSVEEVLNGYRDSTEAVPREHLETVFRLVDGMSALVAELSAPAPAATPVTTATATAPTPTTTASPRPASPLRPGDEPARTGRVDQADLQQLLEDVAETHARVGGLRRTLGTVEQAREVLDALIGELGTGRNREPRGGGSGTRLRPLADELAGLLGNLDRGLDHGLGQVDQELRRVRDAVDRMQLMPAGSLFTALERTARDAAQAMGKRVGFAGRGGDIRIDAQVLTVVQRALVQMVRNAVAHGIELESTRLAAGKPAQGQVLIEVARRGQRIAFSCKDDGRGIDLEAVRQAVERRGLLSHDARALGPEELLRLLLVGGISTSGAVTEVAGRGIGLDVVREASEQLGGAVDVRSTAGLGTVVELTVPLSLASIDALVVEAGGTIASIPLDAVRETVRIAAGELTRSADGDAVVHDGVVIPFAPLTRAIWGRHPAVRGRRPWSAVVVRGSGATAAIGVDRLLGTTSVVVRPLPALAPSAAVIAGASLDAEGNPQVVLDPDALVEAVRRADAGDDANARERCPILVIDDSLTTRMLEQSILESAGYEVELATSGEEGLDKARRRRYSLFLVDVEMPGMDGFGFIEHTIADPTLRDIPSILVTSRTSADDRRRGLAAGARGHIAKSAFDQIELLERIRGLVG